MNDPLETGHFTDDQMHRFIHSLCSWIYPPGYKACDQPVVAPEVITVTPESLYCHEHLADLTAKHAMAHPDDR